MKKLQDLTQSELGEGIKVMLNHLGIAGSIANEYSLYNAIYGEHEKAVGGVTHEWESIGDDLFNEAGFGEVVSVSSDQTYITKMGEQNEKVLKFLQEKYPERTFRLSKWHEHDFGPYQEVEERISYPIDQE